MRSLYSFAFLFVLTCAAAAQNVPAGFDLSNHGVKVEPDTRVMAVLATLEVARTTNEAGDPVPVLNTPLSEPGRQFRDLLTSDLAALDEKLRSKISTFVINHKRRHSGKTDSEIVADFISMAYALTPAPELADPIVTSDLPGSLLDVLDFAPLVRDFYRASTFSANLADYKKQYAKAADGRLQSSTREMVNELLNYLHTRPQLLITEKVTVETQRSKGKGKLQNVQTRTRERKFVIVPELLLPSNTISFVNVKDDYYAVVSPDTNVLSSDVRRAFLQFVVDPIILMHAKDLTAIHGSVKKILDERRAIDPSVSPDVFLTIARSLVSAIDAKQIEHVKIQIATDQARAKIAQMGGSDPTKKVAEELETFKQQAVDETALRLSEDFEKGSVLNFYFAEGLKGVEESGVDIAAAMREMILSFDPAKEAGRYDRYADARRRALAVREERKTNTGTGTTAIAENPVTTRLLEIQKTVGAKDYGKAEADLKELLKDAPDEPRVFYNIGRVASLSAAEADDAEGQSAKLLDAKVAYENVIRISRSQQVDPALRSLAFVALAKIYEFYDNKPLAMGIYDEAIRIGDVSGGAFREALAGKQRLLKEQE